MEENTTLTIKLVNKNGTFNVVLFHYKMYMYFIVEKVKLKTKILDPILVLVV